jgi:hypothetical protein
MNGRSILPPAAAAVALALFGLWTLATWLLEGRTGTLLRPEAVADRIVYAVVANLLIGVVVAVAILRVLVRRNAVTRAATGFGRAAPAPVPLAVAAALGIAFYAVQGAPSLDLAVLTNAFAQVLVVSTAEVIVCWAVLAAAVESWLMPRGGMVAWLGAAIAASILFGLYHFAHSPPFNTPPMVLLLTGVGLMTSLFFLVSRDVYATILFHNFLGVFGVVQALDAADELETFATLQPPLLAMAALTIAVLALCDWALLRRGT